MDPSFFFIRNIPVILIYPHYIFVKEVYICLDIRRYINHA